MTHTSVETRRSYIDCAFGQLHVIADAVAPVDSRPVILLNSRSRSLLKLLPLLRPRYLGIIIDIPGLGLSSPPRAGSSMVDVADCIIEALDALRIERPHWYGFFTGHKVATALAARHPARVDRLIVAGKTHSLVPDLTARNAAMQAYLARRLPDAAIMALEGKYVDDTSQNSGFEAIFNANYAFDFAAALRQVKAPTLIIEVVTSSEDENYGRQGPFLAGLMRDARAIAWPETDPTGLDMYIGAGLMAAQIVEFLSPRAGS